VASERAKPEDQWIVAPDEMTQSVTVFRETMRRGGPSYFGKSGSSDLKSVERRPPWLRRDRSEEDAETLY
jgi:hypothetical protein